MSSRLTGATNKTEAMLDQQPKTNQVKQQPAAPQAVGHGCWQRPTAAHRNTHAHTGHVFLRPGPGVFGFEAINLTAAWMEGQRAGKERQAEEGVWVRTKERTSWGFNPRLLPDCFTGDSYCAKHSCLWGCWQAFLNCFWLVFSHWLQ